MQALQDMISVIICTYNQEQYIGQTLNSILSQKCHVPIEIVIGEDCSTDSTRAICQDYANRYPNNVRLLAREHNLGFVHNYFDCLWACRGRYIGDCAGDDYWCDERKLEKELCIMEQYPDVGIVHTDWQALEEETGRTVASQPPYSAPLLTEGKELLTDILTQTTRPVIHLCTSLYRADWVTKARERHPQFFDGSRYPCEDLQIAFLLARMGRVAYLPDVTLTYRRSVGSLSNPATEERMFRFYAKATQLSVDLASAFDIQNDTLQQFLTQRVHKLLMHAFRAHAPRLRDEALTIQQRWHVSNKRQILQAKLMMLPGIWTLLLFIRKHIKR